MEFAVDLSTMESHILDDYDDDCSNKVDIKRNSLLLAIAERLETIIVLLENEKIRKDTNNIRIP